MKNKSRGFTLIELLVVIAVIGILAAVILASLNSARAKARDAKRIADLSQIRTALTMYYADNGSYPVVSRWAINGTDVSYGGAGVAQAKWTALETTLAPYISKLPVDPVNTGTSGPWITGSLHYMYSSDGTKYDLVAQLEVTTSLMCSVKDWKYHQGEGATPPEGSWCGSYSGRIYADH